MKLPFTSILGLNKIKLVENYPYTLEGDCNIENNVDNKYTSIEVDHVASEQIVYSSIH